MAGSTQQPWRSHPRGTAPHARPPGGQHPGDPLMVTPARPQHPAQDMPCDATPRTLCAWPSGAAPDAVLRPPGGGSGAAPVPRPPGPPLHAGTPSWLPPPGPCGAGHRRPPTHPKHWTPGSSAGATAASVHCCASRCARVLGRGRMPTLLLCRQHTQAQAPAAGCPAGSPQLQCATGSVGSSKGSAWDGGGGMALPAAPPEQRTLTSEMGAPLRSRSSLISTVLLTAAAAGATRPRV